MLPHQNTGAQTAVVAPAQSIVTIDSDGALITTSLAIAAGTGVQREAVIKLVRTHLKALSTFGLVRFEIQPRSAGQHGGGDVEYAILNEPQSALLIAFMRNTAVVVEFKVTLVRQFYEMRAALAARETPANVPRTFADALRLAAAQAEQLEQQSAKISADAPKVAFAETIRAMEGVCHVEKVAKTLGFGRNKFFKMMRADGILMNSNLPYQKYIDRDYFTVIEQDPYTDSKGVAHPTFTAMVTGAGQVFLAKKYATPEMETAL